MPEKALIWSLIAALIPLYFLGSFYTSKTILREQVPLLEVKYFTPIYLVSITNESDRISSPSSKIGYE